MIKEDLTWNSKNKLELVESVDSDVSILWLILIASFVGFIYSIFSMNSVILSSVCFLIASLMAIGIDGAE